MLATAKDNGALHFDTDPTLLTQRCLFAKEIVEAVTDHPLFILVINTATRQQRFNKHEVLGVSNDYIFTTVSKEDR